MKIKYPFEISFFEIVLIGALIGFFHAKPTNNNMGDYLFSAIMEAVVYIIGYCFLHGIFYTMLEKMGEIPSFVILLVAIILFAIGDLPDKNYIDEDSAVNIAYDDGYKDGEKGEYNSIYYKEIFQGKHNYFVK